MKLSKNKKAIIRITVSALLLVISVLIDRLVGKNAALMVYLLAFTVVGYDVAIKAIRNIFHGQILDEKFLMLIASVGAFIIGEAPEAVAIMLLYQVGEVFQRYAVNKSRASISSLMKLRPDNAIIVENGKERQVLAEEVALGSVIVLRPGDRIPLDGEVIEGSGYVDCSALTGESVPVFVRPGECVLSGAINCQSVIKIKTTTEFYSSTVSRVLELAENAIDRKSKAEGYVSKFATVYTPIVVIVAVLLAIIPSVITQEWSKWVYIALTFLVVSCPCAIVISVPLTFFSGLGGITKAGLVVKGSNYVEVLANARTVVMDKTGTVTTGELGVTRVIPESSRKQILELAGIAESRSTHPIAKAILRECSMDCADYQVTEVSGQGVIAKGEQREILVGSREFMRSAGIEVDDYDGEGSVVFVAENGLYKGAIIVSDTLKQSSQLAVASLKKSGVSVIILSGDNLKNVRRVAEKVGVSRYYADCMPDRKLEILEQIMAEKKGGAVAFVGDGINDSPSLARADVGISMGAIGSDSAIEISDAVLMSDDLTSLVRARKICRKTVNIATQNVVLSLFVKISVMLLSVVGFLGMWLAVTSDVGVAIIAILNAMRAGKISNKAKNR